MLLKKFLTKSRIIDITSVDFKGVLTELLATIPDSILGKVSRPSAMKELIERENAISTYLELEFKNTIQYLHAALEFIMQNRKEAA